MHIVMHSIVNALNCQRRWKFAKEIHIYADKDMEQPIGNCKVKCKGKYKRKTTKEIDFFQVEDTDDGRA